MRVFVKFRVAAKSLTECLTKSTNLHNLGISEIKRKVFTLK